MVVSHPFGNEAVHSGVEVFYAAIGRRLICCDAVVWIKIIRAHVSIQKSLIIMSKVTYQRPNL